MALSVELQTDLGQRRGLSAKTLSLCGVRAVGREHPYGMGWVWSTVTLEGVQAERWKSVNSAQPEGATNWAKYRWDPKKPDGNASYYDPDGKLRAAIRDSYGVLWLVGGEIAAMSMFEAGYRNTTCFFGDNVVPATLYKDLKQLGVRSLMMIPDRDASGLKCAQDVRDLLSHDLDFEFSCYALPYDLTDKHGKDVNDLWLQMGAVPKFEKAIADLVPWRLPEPKPNIIDFTRFETGNKELPPRFIEAILQDVQSRATPNKPFRYDSDGWSPNFRCPFHNEQTASAGFNKESMSFKCFVCDSKSAKEYGEGVGIILKDYFDSPVPIRTSILPQLRSTNGNPKEETPVTIPDRSAVAKPQLRPKLPDFAQLSTDQEHEAATGRKWLDDYLTWAVDASPLTPRLFHEAMAIWLLATISTRRMKVTVGGEDIFPNLYILIVARTTIYRKSTAMKLAKSVLLKANLSALLLPSEATPEALFDELAGVQPPNFESLPDDAKQRWKLGRAVAAQRSFMKDEASSIFANLKKDYMAGLNEILLQGYDADSGTIDKRLKSKGLTTVRDLCVSFLGSTTPAMYSKYVTIEEQESGLMPRFAIVTPDEDVPYRYPSDQVDTPYSLIQRLRTMFLDVLPGRNGQQISGSSIMGDVQSPPVMNVAFAPKGFHQLNLYRQAVGHEMQRAETVDDSLSPFYARLGTMAFKVAMLLAAIDTETAPVRVEERHAYAAQVICESWRESLHRLSRDLDKSKSGLSDDNKVLALIRQSGIKGLTMRDIMQSCNLRPRAKAVEALTVLADDGLIEQYSHKPEGRGRPSVFYRLAGLVQE